MTRVMTRHLRCLTALMVVMGGFNAAWACSLADGYNVVPPQGATSVSLNARVSALISQRPQQTFEWVELVEGAEPRPVTATVTQGPGPDGYAHLQVVPETALAPNTRYALKRLGPGTYESTLTTFTTGDSVDSTAPAPPTVEVGDIVPYTPSDEAEGSECYVDRGFIRLTAVSPEATSYDLRHGESLVASGLPSNMHLGFSCPANDRTIQATLTAVDMAGNSSPPVAFEYQERCEAERGPLGCNAGSGPLLLLGAGLVGCWLAAARRR